MKIELMKVTAADAFRDVAQFRTGKFAISSDAYLEKLRHELLVFADEIAEELFARQARRDARAEAENA